MANTIKVKRGTDANRAGVTPAEGELLYTTDTKKVYIGDGSTAGGNEVGGGGSQTPAELLADIKTVDGSGSGLDADTVDGIQGSQFLRSDVDDEKTGHLKLRNNAWLWTQYSSSHDEVRINANTSGGLDVYNQTDAGFAHVNSGGIKVSSTTVIDSSRNLTNIGTITATGGTSTNWNTAYSWGNHASAGYLTSIPTPANGDWWNNGFVRVLSDGVMEVGKYLDFHTADSGGSSDYDLRVTASPGELSVGGTIAATGGTFTGDLKLDSSNAEINLKSGVTGTSGAVNWTFNTDSTNYAAIKLPYDTRATTGLHIDSGYPITIDATTEIDFAISGSKKGYWNNSGLFVGSSKVWHSGNDGSGSGLDADLLDGQHASAFQPAGTYNTIIGTDTDINTSGSTIIDNIYVTDGVITSMGTRTLTAADLGIGSTGTAQTASVGASGWWKCNDTGLIIQWGKTGSISANGNTTVTLPLTMPSAVRTIYATRNESSILSGDEGHLNCIVVSTSQIRIYNSSGGTTNAAFWLVIGN